MSDESMVERVARALCLRCHDNPDSTHGGSRDGGSLPKGQPAWTAWEDDARAAIAAMREPTTAMRHAGVDAVYDGRGAYLDAWDAMITAALSDPAFTP